jgi:hypothetical protein
VSSSHSAPATPRAPSHPMPSPVLEHPCAIPQPPRGAAPPPACARACCCSLRICCAQQCCGAACYPVFFASWTAYSSSERYTTAQEIY